MSKNSSVVYLEIQEMLEDYLLGIPVSPLSWLEISYQEKFNRSLDESLGEKTIEELLVEMRNEGMVLFYEKPESKKRYVLSARMCLESGGGSRKLGKGGDKGAQDLQFKKKEEMNEKMRGLPERYFTLCV
ncbi:hypothetical protein Tco_0019109 [Tanacetum coccineum]